MASKPPPKKAPPKKAPPKKAPSKKALQAARALALSGKADDAIAALEPLGDDITVAYSLLELRAFRGEWEAALALAARILAAPDALATANTFDDTVRLIGLAGRSSRRWPEVEAAAKAGLAVAKRADNDRHATILANLVKYAGRNGAAPHELIEVFGVEDAPRTRAQYDSAVALAATKKRKPDDAARHLFALAVVFGQPDEIVRLFDAHAELMTFDNAVDAARVLVDQGKPDRAWAILSERVSSWWPVDPAQVAPVELLVDDRLGTLANPKRCAAVLATPRGPRRYEVIA